jgi:hypothetical protein
MKRLFLLCVLVVVSSVYAMGDTSTFLDRHGNYNGYMTRDDNKIGFYNKHNMPSGWIDRSSGAMFDGHNNFKGWRIESDTDRNRD